MITKQQAQDCIKLVKQMPKGCIYQPIILPYNLKVKGGHDRSCMIKDILGKEQVTSFLDIGCNVGHLCYLARKSGVTEVLGIEHNSEIYKVTSLIGEAWGFETECQSLQNFQSCELFDVVCLLSVLHHKIDVPVQQIKRYSLIAKKRLVLELPITTKLGIAVESNLGYNYWKWLFNLKDVLNYLKQDLRFKKVSSFKSPLKFHGDVPRFVIIGER
jgi:SAM-dependent methyltransferase